MKKKHLFALSLTGLLVGCFGSSPTPYSGSFQPLEPNTAEWPRDTKDQYPETYQWIGATSREYAWGYLKAYTHAPLATVWGAFQDKDIITDRRQIDEWFLQESCLDDPAINNPDDPADFCNIIHNTVHDIITVDYSMTWAHKITEGSPQAPKRIIIRYQKTWGSNVIPLYEGSIELEEIGDKVTSISWVQHLESISGDDSKRTKNYLIDVYKSVLAFVHDEPLPVYKKK
jgi:hypothetical protein